MEEKLYYLDFATLENFMRDVFVAAGVRILAEETGISLRSLEKLRLGGGFGAFAHRRNSALLGIIPQECKGKTVKLGNTALAGAVSAALSEEARAELLRIRKLVRVIDLPTHPSFSDAFTDAMFFE